MFQSARTKHLQSKRAKIQVESVPPSVDDDGRGAQGRVNERPHSFPFSIQLAL